MAEGVRRWASQEWFAERVVVGAPTGRLPYADRSFDVVFTAERPFAELAIMVASEADTMLFVLDPEGEARCGDDDDGEHPIVRGLFAQGVYRVWVGAEERDASGPFVLALTELDDSRPSRLLH